MAKRFFREKELNYKNMVQMYVGGHMAAFGAGGFFISRAMRRNTFGYSTISDLNNATINATPLADIPAFYVPFIIVGLGALLLPLTWGMLQSKSLRALIVTLFFIVLFTSITFGIMAYTDKPRQVTGFWLDHVPAAFSLGSLAQLGILIAICLGIPVLASGLTKPAPVTDEMLHKHAQRLAHQEALAQNQKDVISPSRRRRRR